MELYSISLFWKTKRKYVPGILAFTHIVLRLYEASAKHLQDMPVKVADRTTQDVSMQTKPVLLIFKVQLYNESSKNVKVNSLKIGHSVILM